MRSACGQAQAHSIEAKTCAGVVVPLLILAVIQMLSKNPAVGFTSIHALEVEEALEAGGTIHASRLPARILAWTIAACGVMMAVLIGINAEAKLMTGIFAAAFLLISGGIGFCARDKASK